MINPEATVAGTTNSSRDNQGTDVPGLAVSAQS